MQNSSAIRKQRGSGFKIPRFTLMHAYRAKTSTYRYRCMLLGECPANAMDRDGFVGILSINLEN